MKVETLKHFLDRVSRDVDRRLDELIPAAGVSPKKLHEAIRWSVFAGGKRFRPASLIAVGEAFGAPLTSLVNSAAAVEMIHTYSLIHDDLPAMDDDDLRRGKPTCHIQFGEATAILAGDVLQTLAFKAVAEDGGLPHSARIEIISLLAAASGTPGGMVSGQQLDLDAEGKELTIAEIAEIHSQKTGALITASAVIGATIAGVSDSELGLVRSYGEKLGLLFQITDDLLDVTQETATLGKTAGKDVSAGKATYPSHYGRQQTAAMVDTVRYEILEILRTLSRDTGILESLVHFVVKRDS